MLHTFAYNLRVVLAVMKKDMRTQITEKVFLFIMTVVPLEYLVLLLLFLLSANHAPTAVVMQDTGLYAQQLYAAMEGAHTFRLQQTSATQAQRLIESGSIVAVVTIPPEFDARVRQHQPVQVGVQINNLNTDFTEDIRRGVPLAITTFYAQAYPHLVNVVTQEQDQYPRDLDYLQYVGVSILAAGVLVVGVAMAGTFSAREWELSTMKELLLSPAPRWCLIAGKMLGAFVMSLGSVAVVMAALVVFLGIWPAHPAAMLGYAALLLAIAVAAGTGLGVLVKQRQLVTTLVQGCAVPLFFLSGPLAPVGYNTRPIQILASVFPVEYGIAGLHYSFYSYQLNTLGAAGNAAVLGAFLVAFVVAAVYALRRGTVTH